MPQLNLQRAQDQLDPKISGIFYVDVNESRVGLVGKHEHN